MIGPSTLAFPYLALFASRWRFWRLRDYKRTDSPRGIGATFTALMVLGIAASIAGPPYLGDHVRIPLGLLLGVLLATSWLLRLPRARIAA